MSLVKAISDSNAAKPSSNMDEITGPSDVGMQGFVQVPFPSQMPAKSNADVGITKDEAVSAQQGTSLGAYSNQPENPNSKSGK